MDTIERIFAIIGSVIVGGGALVTVIYQAFKYLGSKWLDARFNEQLQSLKHRHDQELESLRFKIAALLDRTVKLHQREFEVLPTSPLN